MPPKLEFAAMAAVFLVPFVVLNLLLQATRRGLLATALAAVLVLLAGLGARTAPGHRLLAALSDPRIAVLLAISAFLALLAAALLDRRRARARAARSFWTNPPDNDAFGQHCSAVLAGQGWILRTYHADLTLAICRMERASQRITTICIVRPMSPTQISTSLARLKWRAYGRFVVVTWFEPTGAFLADAHRLGWPVRHGCRLHIGPGPIAPPPSFPPAGADAAVIPATPLVA
ncbi:MAG: hypothetical protein INR65_07865 [Gluconacetobacter diazotrophicus]|nr:hypothetical protein [Gluconacetobacter diazotrophicus]